MEENTIIRTPAGCSSIKELPKGNFELESFNFNENRIEIDTAIKTFSGKKIVYRITTESGNTLEATEDHRFFIKDGSKCKEERLKNLKIGDRLVVI